MLPRNDPDRIQIAFDDHRLVSNAGLILPSTLALHLGLPQLVDRHLDLGRAPGGANPGDKRHRPPRRQAGQFRGWPTACAPTAHCGTVFAFDGGEMAYRARKRARGPFLPRIRPPCGTDAIYSTPRNHVHSGNCSRLRGSDRLSTGIAYLATALGTAKKPADLINSEQLHTQAPHSRQSTDSSQ